MTSYSSNVTISNSTFTNCTGGVTCAYGAAPTINGCTFLSNTFGLWNLNASPLIENNNIQNCSNSGIYLNNSPARVEYNTIRNCGCNGIWFYNSSPVYVYGNTITGCSIGIYCNYYSSPWFLGQSYNVISAPNGWGTSIVADYSSHPDFGDYAPYGGYNSIRGNTNSYVSATGSSVVTAEYNWWDVYPPNPTGFYADQSSTIDHSNPLQSDPNQGRQKVGVPIPSPPAVGPLSDSTFFLAFQADRAGSYDDAIALYLKVFMADASSPSLVKQALLFLADSYDRSGKTDFLNYLDTQINPKASTNPDLTVTTRELRAQWLVKGGRYADAISMYQSLRTDLSQTPEVDKYALFNMGEVYSSYLGDHAHAVEALTLFQAKYPNDPLAPVASFLLSTIAGTDAVAPQVGKGTTTPRAPAPAGFALESNYPNPFNPSTQISYSLPEPGKVSLMIYDVLGREIINLTDGYQQIGRYTATWNSQSSGIPVSSGVYFARLRVLNDLGQVTFTKTTRLLLMK